MVKRSSDKGPDEYAKTFFYVVELVLCNFGGIVVNGFYEFPFEFLLPYGLPGKQGLYVGDCFIVDYHLEATLLRTVALRRTTPEIKKSIEVFMVGAHLNHIPAPVFILQVHRLLDFSVGILDQ